VITNTIGTMIIFSSVSPIGIQYHIQGGMHPECNIVPGIVHYWYIDKLSEVQEIGERIDVLLWSWGLA
jgi:hypothetical protein